MADYRIYCLDRIGHIGFADWIKAASDLEAVERARTLKPDADRCEIWLGNRLVAKLDSAGEFEMAIA